MKNKKIETITPVQPYLALRTEDYKKLITETLGISHFYEFTVKEGEEVKVNAVPDGSVDLLFGIGTKDVHTFIGGTVFRVKKWPIEPGRVYFGVRFQPGKCILPRDLSIQDIINDDLEIDGNCYGKSLAEEIAEAKNMKERAEIFVRRYVDGYVVENEQDAAGRMEEYIRNRIYESKGNISIGTLAEETGYSECYIRRIFGKIHGISPKVFEKFVRFQNTLNLMGKEKIGLEELAAECGYYDQSHMIKDFKNFSGVTPEAYLNLISEKRKETDE